jgi:hypothetical protein
MALLVSLWSSVQAQEQPTLIAFSPVIGSVAAGSPESWTFFASEGQVVSLSAEATSGDLDPVLNIVDRSGNPLIGNDDLNYPEQRGALLEAITLPRTETYTAVVSSHGTTSGSYRLTLTHGFSQTSSTETFDGEGVWRSDIDALIPLLSEDALWLNLSGINQQAMVFQPNAPTFSDFYAQVNVEVSGQDGWTVGMTARQQDTRNLYLFMVNQRGEWRFILREDGSDTILRDWTTHPAIVPGGNNFALGMLVNRSGFDFFYNNQPIGRLSDGSIAEAGSVGFYVGTGSSLSSQTNVRLDDLIVTTPLEIDGQRAIPDQLMQGGNPNSIARELQRRSVIPAGGEMALVVQESFIESRRPGVETLELARGSVYGNMVIGTTMTWEAAPATTGCGLILRATGESDYLLAYIDQGGGYGFSQRQGDVFLPGIFEQIPAFSGNTHSLVVVARGSDILIYVDGRLRGNLTVPDIEGGIGNAVVNFEPVNTSCQFSNTWLWTWRG